MTTAKQLLKLIRDSGTGRKKLVGVEVWVDRNPDATADQLIAAMESMGLPEVTITKARELKPGRGRPKKSKPEKPRKNPFEFKRRETTGTILYG